MGASVAIARFRARASRSRPTEARAAVPRALAPAAMPTAEDRASAWALPGTTSRLRAQAGKVTLGLEASMALVTLPEVGEAACNPAQRPAGQAAGRARRIKGALSAPVALPRERMVATGPMRRTTRRAEAAEAAEAP